MRYVRTIRARTPPESREEYLSILEEVSAHCRDASEVQGFYLMESADQSGDFWEFYEFADEPAAERYATRIASDPRQLDLVRRLREIVPEELTDTSFWNQRI